MADAWDQFPDEGGVATAPGRSSGDAWQAFPDAATADDRFGHFPDAAPEESAWWNKSLLPHVVAPQQEGIPMQIVAGVNNAAGNLAESLATPLNLALLPATQLKRVGRLVSAGFGAKMLSDVPASIAAAEAQPTVQGRLEGGLGALGNLFLGIGAAGHAAGLKAGAAKAAKAKPIVIKSFADLPDLAPAPEAPADVGPVSPPGGPSALPPPIIPDVQTRPGEIPIEGLPAPEPRTLNPEPAAPAASPLWSTDEAIPFMTRVRSEDALKTQHGLSDEQIAGLTTPEVAELLAKTQQPVTPSNVELSPAPVGAQTLTDAFQQMGQGISSNFYDQAFEALRQGKNTIAGVADPILSKAKPLFDAGQIKSAADLQSLVQSGELNKLTPEQRAEAQYRADLLDEASAHQSGQGHELKDAIIRAGGLPSRGSPHRTAEIHDLEQTILNPARSERIAPNQIFRKNAPALDDLVTGLRDQGFDLKTPADLYDLLDQRFRTGKPIYGQPEAARLFASGSSAPRAPKLRSGENQGDLLSGQTEELKLVGEKGIDHAARQQAAEVAAVAKAQADAASEGQQGKLFASGAAAPTRPHAPTPAPAPRPPPIPTPPSAPAVARAAAPLRSWWQQRTLGIRKLVAPQTIDRQARTVANIVRDYNGHLANKIAQADTALAAARADFDRTPVPSAWKYDPNQRLPRNYAFMAEGERGGGNLSPADLQLKQQMDAMFAEAVNEVHRVKPLALKSLIQDYFPHIWTDPAKAQQVFASIIGHRPLEGSKTFLKQRTLHYIEEGLERGLKPVSDNPVDMVLTKLHEVHKFVAAQDILTEAKAIGARKFVYIFEKPPEGWALVDDPSSKVNAPPFITVPEAFDEQMKVKTVELLNKLGVPHERVARLGGTRWGTAQDGGTPPGRIRTKFAGPLSVYWHELGHVLEFRYKWLDTILGDAYDKQGRNIGQLKHTSQAPVAKELRALADLRAGSGTPSASFQKYLRNRDEKAAVMLEAYMHAPQKMQQVAPLIFGRVRKFIAAHPELAPIEEIRPSLVLGSAKTKIDVGGMVTLGHWYMPEGAATVLSNYLSPGLQRFGIIRNIRSSTNILSGLQLGFSAFHAGFTSIDAAVSQFALGLRYASEGKLATAAGKIATSPIAPVTNYLSGRQVQRAMLEPGYGTPELQAIAELAQKAGLRATVDPFWRTQITRNMIRAMHEGGVKGFAGTVLRAPFAASEQMMRPILEYLVPRQKLGVFAGMAEQHMARLGPNADIHQVRDAMAHAADATEDRMGQMTYDNLFYHRIVRDTALLSFRAYGWTFGKYRALFGGIGDTLATVGRVKDGGPVLTDRMAYLLALPIMAGAIGSVMNYTMTGQAPQDWKDALMPRTGKLDRNGNPERLSLPTYLKDILSDWHDFPNTKKMLVSFGHKLNPGLAIVADIINNADFFGTKVYNEDDPFLKRQLDKVLFVAKSAEPFSVTSSIKLNESNPTLAQRVLPFLGFVPAKAALTMSPAQARAAELMRDMLPKGARTPEQALASQNRAELIKDLKTQDAAAPAELAAALLNGTVSPAKLAGLIQSTTLTPLQYQVKKLPADGAMKVWDLATAEERQQLRVILTQKLMNSKSLTPVQRAQYFRVLSQPEANR